ncbi:MAG: YibE/F family protein [Candidatus Rifleibacteriota bacterium]
MSIRDKSIIVVGLVFMSAFLYYIFGSTSQGIYCKATVLQVIEQPNPEPGNSDRIFEVELDIHSGPFAGKKMKADHFDSPGSAYNLELKVGDAVLAVIEQQDDQMIVGIDEYYKSRKLMAFSMMLILLISLIAGVAGIKALLALILTLVIIFGGMAQMLLNGWSPVLLAVSAALIITIMNLVMVAGFTKKAMVASAGTFSGVILAGLFGWFAAEILHLTGYTGHESTFLQIMNANLSLKGILIAGIIIGALGAVMDVAISIASAIQEVARANPSLTQKDLFSSGMNIGRDIIGTMVNTLILAYTGASLTLILVFAMQKEDFPLIKIMNMEFIGAEIVRSLAGLGGMVLAIPFTALVASYVFVETPRK